MHGCVFNLAMTQTTVFNIRCISHPRLLLSIIFSLLLVGCSSGGGGAGAGAASNGAPSASFTVTPSFGVVPLVVQFDASASHDSDGQIVTYHWDFGDGQSGSGESVSHAYTLVGIFYARLTVTDNSGARASTTRVIGSGGYTISGAIGISSGSVVDSDVNDPNASYINNDTYTVAQALPNPVNLGGYLNVKGDSKVAGTGIPGRSLSVGDYSDFYSISLVAGQTISVSIEDAVAGNLDLHLYHDDGSVDPANPDFASLNTGATEALTVATSGDYFIEVYVTSGYSAYTLVVGQAALLNLSGRLVSSDDFVPGDVLVKFKDGPVGIASMNSTSDRAAALGLQVKAGSDHKRTQLMKLGDVSKRGSTFDILGMSSNPAQRQFRSNDLVKQLKLETLQVIQTLRQRPDVLYAEPNFIHQATAVPSDPLYSFQWHYPLINLPTAWDMATGADVTVAVVDTGVLLGHPDLSGQFPTSISTHDGYDFIVDDANSNDGEPGIDGNPNDAGDGGGGRSSSFHGTHVAGTIAAATVFSPATGGVGVAGVAPGAKVMPLRVLGQNGAESYDILQAVRYAAGLANDSGITLNASQRAEVINLSLGRVGGYSQLEQNVYTAVRDAGVIVVAAAGNENNSAFSYPASYAGVISVSAVDINKQKAPYSSFGTAVDIAAPGGNSLADVNGDGYIDGVLSTLADDASGSPSFNYAFYQGTSMAAPHVAGVIALMKSVHSGLTPSDVDSLLLNGLITEDLGVAGRDDIFGHGLINAFNAVAEAQALASVVVPNTPVLGISPAALNVGAVENSAILSVTNAGNGVLTITSVTENSTWLTVTSGTVDAAGLGTYQVTIDRSGLAPGTYQENITFVSSTNTIVIPILIQVVVQSINGDAGYHYALLVDASDFSFVDEWSGPAQGGQYLYQFYNVTFPAGREYYVVAGSDLNNDLFICGVGEACGAYFTLGNFRAIGESGPYSGIDFTTNFSAGIGVNAVLATENRPMGIRRQTANRQWQQNR